jgi:methyl-accepting chemotaxis protein
VKTGETVGGVLIAILDLNSFGAEFVVVRQVLQPIRLTVAGLQDLSQGNGDLTKRLTQRSSDEVGELACFFNLFVEKLHDVIVKVMESTLQVTNASQNLAVVNIIGMNHQIASAAEEQ